jgi:uroporphyrin-III C-methyltransferase
MARELLRGGGVKGKVYLIGAGPGDVELLTLKAVRALERSDVALIDDLVSREILQFLRPRTRVIDVGKRGGCRSTPQSFIERQLVRLARRGLCVARVKGGDPFVFGRGGEELEILRAAGVDVEVVNGITAGLAIPAALGIPVTHRHLAHGVTLVTGHTRNGAGPNWDALARCGTTLVIYMGIGNLPDIVSGLRGAGMADDTSVAVVQNGTLQNERRLVTRLGTVVDDVSGSGLGSPAIIVIGDVVRLAAAGVGMEAVREVARTGNSGALRWNG